MNEVMAADTGSAIQAGIENTPALTSNWLKIDQALVDRFADVIDDHQFIHVNPARAANEGIFGGTIAHGFLLLSLLTKLSRQVFEAAADDVVEVNYGFDKVRFLTPVLVGANIRGHFRPSEKTEKGGGTLQLFNVMLEIEGLPKPALVADWLILTTKNG